MSVERKLAVLDLGSNSVRMEIYQIMPDGSFRSVVREKRLVRLSEHMGNECILKPIPIHRTLRALRDFKRILDETGADDVRAMATEAVRRAKNGRFFLQQAEKETGFHFRILRGQEEAAYDCMGVSSSLDMEDYIMLDTGGGSVEIALVLKNRLSYAVSLPLGSVVLSEKWGLGNRITAAQCFDVMMDVSREYQQVRWLEKGKNFPVVVLGGSNRILGRLHMLRRCPERSTLHNYRIEAEDIFRMFREMLLTDAEERKAMPGMEAERANIIIGGLAPLVVLLLHLESEGIIVCLEGLRMGVLQEYRQELKKKNFFRDENPKTECSCIFRKRETI